MTSFRRKMASRCLTAIALSLASESAVAQAQIPRTPDGHPDFQGVWESRWMTPVERLPTAPGLIVDVVEAKRLQDWLRGVLASLPGNNNPDSDVDFLTLAPVDGHFRTGMIIDPLDGMIPFSEEGKRVRSGRQLFANDNPEERSSSERCIGGSGRAPMVSGPTNAYVSIGQTGGQIALLTEGVADLRLVPVTAGAPAPRAFPTLHGDSSARWEGDTLVIETRNARLDYRYAFPTNYVVITPKTVVEERFTLTSADAFMYRFVVTDPDIYTRPWTAETVYIRSAGQIHEYACHEGNYAMANILKGGRTQDRLGIPLADRQR